MLQDELEAVVITNDNPSDKFEIPSWAASTASTDRYYSENHMLNVMYRHGWRIARVIKLERQNNLGKYIVTWVYFERPKRS